ncbi:hypothetical protein ACEN2I_15745 [Flavobacterium sp. W22_SRS_FK3]|uniref:hypothetical protein n=1 Tax=Flavobacterium sp. W22_SRS_FK3 TaxID=3240275 RepID=UPI003F9360C4
MSPSEKGRFCINCQKEDIDFTKSCDREIFLAHDKGEKLCGQFRVIQLDRNISIPKEKKINADDCSCINNCFFRIRK